MKLIAAKELKRRVLDGCFLPDWVRVLINRVIDDMPDVDAEPVVHAHWENHPDFYGFVRCSNCKDNRTSHFEMVDELPRCSVCGAHMDEVIKDGKS